MKWLRSLIVPVLMLGALAALATWWLPSRWEVSRSIDIAASPADIHARVADLRAWESWSPFEQQHPDMRFAYSAVTFGVDARRDWTSPSMGDGWMQITAADPARGVWYDTGFRGSRPYKGVLLYEAVSSGTRVTWTAAGDVGGRALFRWTLPMMDTIFGPPFEQGLANLKSVVEGAPPRDH